MNPGDTILSIQDLHVEFPINIGTVRAVQGVSLELKMGEVMGLVGESGCGKSTLGFSILRLLRPPGRISGGKILYRDRDIAAMDRRELLALRGSKIAMIFQDPLTSLNPLYSIGDHFVETLKTHEKGLGRKDALVLAERMLESLGIAKDRLHEYPHQMSGGMRQRIMIGLALIMNPDLLIADEPTTALDVIVEAQFLDLLNDLKNRFNLTIILITHNLGNVAQLADRITVMYGGAIAEVAPAGSLFHDPLHPYTRGLLASIPNIRLDQPKLMTMPGSPPDLVDPPAGCVFHPRCPHTMDICRKERPPIAARNGHLVNCWLYKERP
ncbi:MAG TPA: ABC transporter ATP-binding protein [Deltaproteobacteria bacterium]|nr:ABC transporter ATP-binding protein [Deltaproteobacteria bacterium]HPR55979.1 ABC transporter ATP-binding protein [Deltaproteobacteria bacterium]HXK46579.1 ABC transporter ATP-binding protein [Deltaproteobacteria bacterium]